MKRYKMLILGLAITIAAVTSVFAKEVSKAAIIMEEKPLDNGIIINGKPIEGKIYTKQGQEMIPLRKSAEALGFKVSYDSKNNTINLDDGMVKTTLTIGKDIYYKTSSGKIGLTQPISLGVAPIMIDDSTYIPASLYNLLYSNDQTVTAKENAVIINTENAKNTVKKVDFNIGKKKYTLSMNVPSEISQYANFEKHEVGEKDNKHIVLSLKFSKEDKIANIASLSIYTLNQYEDLKKEAGPMPQEIITNKEDDMVVAFSGLQSNPFEIGTEEAKLIDGYQANVGSMLETMKVD